MPSLLKLWKDKVAENKDCGIQEGQADIAYPSGFLGLDFLNGSIIHVKNERMDFKYNSVGIIDGSATTIIGRTKDGKSTLLVQICSNIIRPFLSKGAAMYIDDPEGGLTRRRIECLTNFTPEEINEHVFHRNTGITVENFFFSIKTIYNIKLENRDELEYDTGLFDSFGSRIFKLIPTVYIVDSIPNLLPKDILEKDELGSQVDTTTSAKSLSQTFRKITQLCKEANIMLFSVNHILEDVQMNSIFKKPRQIAGLKENERLPGGRTAQYLASNLFRIDVIRKLDPEKEFGILGTKVNFTIIKSRSNASERSIPLIFEFETGYDPILSLYELLKDNKKIEGAGRSFHIVGSDIKFSQKEFKNKLSESQELQKAFTETAYEILKDLLSSKEEREVDSVDDINNSILKMGLLDIPENIPNSK